MEIKIKRELVTSVMIGENARLTTGDTVKFTDGKRVMFGVFNGVNSKGALVFKDTINKAECSYNVMPYSIKEIEVIEHEVK